MQFVFLSAYGSGKVISIMWLLKMTQWKQSNLRLSKILVPDIH